MTNSCLQAGAVLGIPGQTGSPAGTASREMNEKKRRPDRKLERRPYNLSDNEYRVGAIVRIDLLSQIRSLLSVQDDNPELLKAQFAALSRLVPLLYFILVANAWVLAVAYFGEAPNWLSIYAALFLSSLCAIRLVKWWYRRKAVLTKERAAAELKRTNKLTAVLGIAFSVWAISLYPYGDAYQKAQVASFMTMTMLCCMLCLIHLRSAVLIIAFTVSLPGAIFLRPQACRLSLVRPSTSRLSPARSSSSF